MPAKLSFQTAVPSWLAHLTGAMLWGTCVLCVSMSIAWSSPAFSGAATLAAGMAVVPHLNAATDVPPPRLELWAYRLSGMCFACLALMAYYEASHSGLAGRPAYIWSTWLPSLLPLIMLSIVG